jgi:catechol 2,3-dioxygenase-like lactoylglutathione lyase family enzyme
MAASVGMSTPGVHHVALRVSDYARAKRFYTETLGFPVLMEAPNLLLFAAGGTPFGIRGPESQTAAGDRFDPFRVGLDHIALACTEETELERVALALAAAGVENTGVKLDETLGKRYVAFKDPDRIAWELYMA